MPDSTSSTTTDQLSVPTPHRRSPFDEWVASNADVVAFLTAPDFNAEGSRYLDKLADRLGRRRPLSPNEVAAVLRNIARRTDRDQRLTNVGDIAATTGTGEPAPVGRTLVEGAVVDVAVRPGFETTEVDYKMIVDCGYLVWCTVPQALILAPQTPDLGLTGAHVRFTATLTPWPGNPSIATGKAPRSVALVSPPPSRDQRPAQAA